MVKAVCSIQYPVLSIKYSVFKELLPRLPAEKRVTPYPKGLSHIFFLHICMGPLRVSTIFGILILPYTYRRADFESLMIRKHLDFLPFRQRYLEEALRSEL